ncbi:MAG TPA: hypothetical protein VGO59_00365 [Verrucomicrobiae bacterium]|jgi:hypothetical protein
MNPNLSIKTAGLGLAALLLSAAAAFAQTTVTFQVDMSNNPLTAGQTVAASGTFDGWANLGSVLTNDPASANPNLYTGAYVDSSDGNGKGMDWQYRIISGGSVASYSGQDDNDNYCVTLPGGSLVLPVQFWDDDGAATTNSITFQVDMAEQLHLGKFDTSDGVYCQGSFEGWNDSFPLTNNPALNVTNAQGDITSLPYQGTYTAWSASPGAAAEYKFVFNNGSDQYEAPVSGDPDNNENRGLLNVTQVLPLVSYSDALFNNTVTNNVTFIIDMSVQTAVGNFDAATGSSVEIHGDYNGWGAGTTMTNSPADPNKNHYYFDYSYVGGAGTLAYFKYVIQPGTQWENVSASNSIGGNRWQMLESGNSTNGPVYFSDEGPGSLNSANFVTVSNCDVTFTVDMSPATNGTFNNGGPFILGFDNVYLNGLNGGVNNSYWTWGALDAPPPYEMTEISNTPLYTITLPINEGQGVNLTYKYGINGADDEASSGDNHSRYIRSFPTYSMPTDVFASQGSSTSAEQSFGNLTISNTSSNQVALSWLGRTGVFLQSTPSLNPPVVWTSLPATDGANLQVTQGPGNMPPAGYASTNYTVGSGSLFYRLAGPQ